MHLFWILLWIHWISCSYLADPSDSFIEAGYLCCKNDGFSLYFLKKLNVLPVCLIYIVYLHYFQYSIFWWNYLRLSVSSVTMNCVILKIDLLPAGIDTALLREKCVEMSRAPPLRVDAFRTVLVYDWRMRENVGSVRTLWPFKPLHCKTKNKKKVCSFLSFAFHSVTLKMHNLRSILFWILFCNDLL